MRRRPIITCARCQRERKHRGRGLCDSCHILTAPAPHGDGTRDNYPLKNRPTADTLEDYRFLLAQGFDDREITQRLGFSHVDRLRRTVRIATANEVSA